MKKFREKHTKTYGSKIKTIVADDHPLVREGIKKVFENEIDLELCGMATNSNELVAMLESGLPDIVILDMDMPGKSGLDLLKDIKSRYANLPVIILTIHPAERFAVRCLKAGASGYLCKSNLTGDLIKAIREIVIRGRKYITDEVAEQLALQVDIGKKSAHENLSDREFEILCMIAKGQNIARIASQLMLSSNTIHTYRSRIKEKLNLKSNVEIAHYAIENSLINLSLSTA